MSAQNDSQIQHKQPEPQADKQAEQSPQQSDSNQNQTAAAQQAKVYDESYVKELRAESAGYRIRATEFETKNTELARQIEQLNAVTRTASLKAAIASSETKFVSVDDVLTLMDKSALKWNEQTGEYEGVADALKKLVESKPYLVAQTGVKTSPTNPPRKNSHGATDLKSALANYYQK